MKKQIGLALGLAVLSSGAIASKARLQALGEDVDGSYFIQDPRNIFYNPARSIYHKDGVILEWGDTAHLDDSAAEPRAEGGVLKSSGNMVYGIYFGNQADNGNGYKGITGTGINEMNTVSASIAGEAGVQWGFAFTYGQFDSKDKFVVDAATPANERIEGEASLLRTRFGVITGDYEFFGRLNLINEAESKFNTSGAANTQFGFEGKAGWQVGTIANIGDMTYAAVVSALGGEDTGNITGRDTDHEYMAIEVQAGQVKQLNDKATMNWRVGVKRQTEEGAYLVTASDIPDADVTTNAFTAAAKEVEILKVPVNIGLEFMAKEWLVLRGSISHNLWSSAENDGDSFELKNSTVVTAGAGLIFGDLIIDGMIGNSDNTGALGEDTAQSNGTLNTDTLMSRVAMTYKF